MTSSNEITAPSQPAGIVRRESAQGLLQADVPELPTGAWTRLGQTSVHGDAVTESALNGLAGRTRAAARAEGYAVGWAEGRRAAVREAEAQRAERDAATAVIEGQRAAEHADAMTALDRAAQALREEATAVAARIEDAALELARELTRGLVGHELRTSPDLSADTVRRTLALLPEDVSLPVTVRLHPAVAGTAGCNDLRDRGVQVVPDASLDRSDVVVETPVSVVDARLSAALDRVLAVLS